MGGVNKLTAAVIAGALCTLIVTVWGAFVTGPPLGPEAQAAIQTLLTAVFVYFGPANTV